jgi:hypothetical protein
MTSKHPGVRDLTLTYAPSSPEPWRTCWRRRNLNLAAGLRRICPSPPSNPSPRAVFISLIKRAPRNHIARRRVDFQGIGNVGGGWAGPDSGSKDGFGLRHQGSGLLDPAGGLLFQRPDQKRKSVNTGAFETVLFTRDH